jgi:hypothetical protein
LKGRGLSHAETASDLPHHRTVCSASRSDAANGEAATPLSKPISDESLHRWTDFSSLPKAVAKARQRAGNKKNHPTNPSK